VTAQITVLFNDSVPVAQTHERSVTLALKGELVAKGTVSVDDGTTACVDRVPVVIQKKKSGGWKPVAKTKTKAASDGSSTYRVAIPDKPGRYRAKVPKVVLGDSSVCTSDTSPTRKNN
jgi:hypothetical protein